MRPKKSYGQHFLKEPRIAERIANSLTLVGTAYQTVVEIGPGKGMLTQYLVDQNFDLFMVEADRDMVGHLLQWKPELKERLLLKDFMKWRPDGLIEQPFAVIGNFPYNISSQIVIKVLEYKDQVPEMVGMFQREMAERIVAKHGNKTYGVLSVLTQAYYEAKLLFRVSKGSFNPPPKVESAVIRLKRKSENPNCSEKWLRLVVKQSFQQRRKMLRNTLKSLIHDPDSLGEELLSKRPEQLSVNDFIELANTLEEQAKNR
ncbi:MAG: 16S rRNA (adenine(1518)-N(6)/adenine(1519)-N(6))-dimethyltransferase RsmA [Bacteroidota bacterium]